MQIKWKNIYKSCVALSALSIWAPSFVFAQNNDEGSVTDLKSIVIEGKQDLDPSSTVTILTDRQTAQNIEQKQVSDVHDVNRLNSSISYNSSNDSFIVRGLDANRVLTTIDGIPLPWLNDEARSVKGGNSTFDFNTLSTFDLIQGSDSSIYGSGALGGIIALRTLNPEDLLTEEKNWGSLTKGSYNSVDNSWQVDQAYAVRANQTFVLFQGSLVGGHERKNMGSIGDYGTKRTLANPADFDQNNLLFKVHQYFDHNHRLSFTAERFHYNKDTHVMNAPAIYFPESVHEENKKSRERFSLSYDYEGSQDTLLDAFHGQIYWQNQLNNHILSGNRVVSPKGNYLRDNQIRNTTYGLNTNSIKKVDIGTTTNTLQLAINIFESKFHQYASGKDNCHLPENARGCAFLHTNQSDAPDTNSRGFGLAFENEIDFYRYHVRITPGIRYDWYTHNPQETASYGKVPISQKLPSKSSSSHFSPKLRLEWDIHNQVALYAQWAQAFRAPSVSELYLNYINPSFYYRAGNPDLKPETSNGYDLGVKYGNMNFGGSFGAFINDYKNFIDLVDKGPSREFRLSREHYVNRAHVRIFGVETKAHWNLDNGLHSDFSLSYAHGKDLDKKEYLSSIPALKTIFGLGYAKEFWGLDFVLTLAAKNDKVAKKSSYREVPGYSLVDVLSWWKPFGKDGLTIRAGVYNIFNTKYWNASDLPSVSPRGESPLPKDYFSQPGRSFKVSFVQKF
ncbi:TonB-dependent hemoglobin/transferrin/lactoferrin family receptor [Bartonella bacilliformis]|uniref:TonB-dependent heme/hemoglobin receptor family protein n=2 Tax=Bartonella bacilliformis TaxID=774 RepID=A1US24_BARBK|nr:TonB-dependent hemoglobin/transferrin/lactoferrin family receptor [Bartonella bacilliformis]ABM45677.1 TonB-dependent heme/hemoglobin receptor family protein [Bartonella bacilliformis KC583]AMG85612.1 TonB-dependent hemoglobin/transferrin/lactoferrin family receptor [Bartonella bacilliformis]EKS45026.1 TonB-dependent heme/hemoglobin receptor family protein [Bartonella bacilliformis INS]EYS90095.1 hypothetical protein X472_00549 [Bartonella bacilliformis San Pedro600-02]